MIRRDAIEAVANAVAGLIVSALLVAFLRAVGLWDAPVAVVSAFFFLASVGRTYALRRLFRWWDAPVVVSAFFFLASEARSYALRRWFR